MKKTARVIITSKCDRKCPGCCNSKLDYTSLAKVIGGITALKDYEEVVITGGEPMINPAQLYTVIKMLRKQNKRQKIYQNNYGSDFTNEAIVQRVTREVSTRGTVQATLNSGGGLKDAIKEALDDLGITTAVNDISRNTKTQADKKEQTIVEIGGKTVTDAVTTQRNANGYSFQGA